MILFTFVENCFKHGSGPEAGKSFIDISLSADSEQILFRSENSYPILKENKNSKGLGLENVKKRLEFLYPGEHKLEIIKEDKIFKVSLELNNKGV
jgi:LytS/YehU family sensor histidine kinase